MRPERDAIIKARAPAADATEVTHLVLAPPPPPSPPAHRYFRVGMGGEGGEPGITLYEVDADGWVHRHVQLFLDGSRFSPEDILICQPIVSETLSDSPGTVAIERGEFEAMWREVHAERAFRMRVPEPSLAWTARIGEGRRRATQVAWAPQGAPGADWSRVPGFVELYVQGDRRQARAVCAALFVEAPIEWSALHSAA